MMSAEEGVKMMLPAPRVRRWTREDYHRMSQAGLLREQDRVELVDGDVVEMSPISPSHSVSVTRTSYALMAAFGPAFVVRVQQPLALGGRSEPEPDLSVIRSEDLELADHPGSPLLVVEVADSSLRYDRTRKARLYAGARVAEYWIVNLGDRRLEVFRDPVPKARCYRQTFVLTEDEEAGCLALPGACWRVRDFLPRRRPV